MQVLHKYCRVMAMLVLASGFSACANDPVKREAEDAKSINYGCQGTSINDCMTFHTPVMGSKPSR